MTDNSRPYSSVKSPYGKWYCKGPIENHRTYDTEEEANLQVFFLNAIYSAGYFANQDKVKLARLESDIKNAYNCAKEYVPDYPWPTVPDMSCQASTAVYACGEAYKGISAACEEWRSLFEHLAPEAYKALFEKVNADPKAYDTLLQEIKDKKAK